ncbi:peptidoglycan recognition protein family protein [Paenibacillus alkaliterrae]|uniref:peptidoglycan recognition protein family protein n=1 Tax=Paenibacillus alkaliterrae TaxID=320909 RepID=UPI001F21024E|nr:peptidoglycan recognition family protein [Paenibacillus alkaliterrae]MCF2938893.1 peptidoglycan recognition protein family protein [Paenibacillus alkaliterrae]
MTLLSLIPALLSNGIPPIQNIIDQLPNHPTKVYQKRDLSQVTRLIVHHTASEAPLINQAKYHVNGRNWPRIGYHFVIHNGAIYQTNYLDTESYHTSGNNRTGIGVAILGDLTKRSITKHERELITALLASLRTVIPDAEIKGHNECGVKTRCPATSVDAIREDVMTLEMEIEQAQSKPKQEELAYRMANSTLYYYNLAKGKKSDGSPATEGEILWGLNQLLKLEPEFRRLGFLK